MYIPICRYGDARRISIAPTWEGRNVKIGSFARVRGTRDHWRVDEWLSCREKFHDASHGIRRMIFRHRRNTGTLNIGYNIACFIGKVEDRLQIEPRSRFGPTQRNTIVWIEASPWWTTSSLKRSLFTILIRAGQNYNPFSDNFEKALFGNEFHKDNEYASDTRYAVERFLKGNTHYTGTTRGWYTAFRYRSLDDERRPTKERIRELLVKSPSISLNRERTQPEGYDA